MAGARGTLAIALVVSALAGSAGGGRQWFRDGGGGIPARRPGGGLFARTTPPSPLPPLPLPPQFSSLHCARVHPPPPLLPLPRSIFPPPLLPLNAAPVCILPLPVTWTVGRRPGGCACLCRHPATHRCCRGCACATCTGGDPPAGVIIVVPLLPPPTTLHRRPKPPLIGATSGRGFGRGEGEWGGRRAAAQVKGRVGSALGAWGASRQGGGRGGGCHAAKLRGGSGAHLGVDRRIGGGSVGPGTRV